MSIIITKHAYSACKKRYSWKKSTTDNMAEKAYSEGMAHTDLNGGTVKRYIGLLWERYRKANNIRIYGSNIFFFKGSILLTSYQLPSKLQSKVNNLKKHLEERS